nr:DNA translocase FtsK [Oscillochloris trichoides]
MKSRSPHLTSPRWGEEPNSRRGEAPNSRPQRGQGGGGGDEALVPNETEWVATKARDLERVLRRRGIQIMKINPDDADVGPSIVRFKFRLAGNESLKKVQTMAEDLARDLALPGTPIIDNISRSTFAGIDIPRERSETIPLRPLLDALGQPGPAELPVILGKTPDGTLIREDLADFPHLLVAGATGSGKSVFLRGLLLSLLTQYRPGNLELLIVDPKRTDFTFFNRLPYLRGGKVIVDGNEARTALLELARSEMQRRQDLIANRSMRMKEFNQRYPDEAQPPIVALIDEYALLTNMMDKKERESFEQDLMILAAASRAVSIHLIIATQHPSAEIVTSKLKANLDARIAFKVATNTNSRVVLDTPGAENLLGNGDMLFRRKSGEIIRIQAPFMDEMTMMEYLKQIG